MSMSELQEVFTPHQPSFTNFTSDLIPCGLVMTGSHSVLAPHHQEFFTILI
jgi:hypothetical protein